MVWTFFVLDYDETYNCCDDEEPNGVTPSVYLIPLDKQKEVERCATDAHDSFHTDEDSDFCITDYFEQHLSANGIKFKFIGEIELPFKERQVNYLADYIPREVV